jgi:hypothetical protein
MGKSIISGELPGESKRSHPTFSFQLPTISWSYLCSSVSICGESIFFSAVDDRSAFGAAIGRGADIVAALAAELAFGFQIAAQAISVIRDDCDADSGEDQRIDVECFEKRRRIQRRWVARCDDGVCDHQWNADELQNCKGIQDDTQFNVRTPEW